MLSNLHYARNLFEIQIGLLNYLVLIALNSFISDSVNIIQLRLLLRSDFIASSIVRILCNLATKYYYRYICKFNNIQYSGAKRRDWNFRVFHVIIWRFSTKTYQRSKNITIFNSKYSFRFGRSPHQHYNNYKTHVAQFHSRFLQQAAL